MRIRQHKILLTVATLVMTLLALQAYATGDTVKYRKIVGTLGDSTRIQYEIGSFGLKQSGNLRYLSFYSNDENISTYFKTEPFVISSSNDSLCFGAFVNYDDKDYDKGTEADTGTQAFYDYVGSVMDRYTDFFVTPNNSYFSSTSTIYFILRLYKYSDNSLLSVLDSTKCYKNGSGKLVYRNYPSSLFARFAKLQGVSIGDTVYLQVDVVKNLPNNSDFIGYDYAYHTNNNPVKWEPDSPDDFTFPHQIFIPSGGSITQAGLKSNNPVLNELQIYPNPVTGNKVTLHYSSKGFGPGTLRIYTINGEMVLEKNIVIPGGKAQYEVSLSNLPSGKYILYLYLDDFQASTLFSLVK